MEQDDKRQYLIRRLLDEQPEYRNEKIPAVQSEQKRLLRGLLNIRMPAPCDEEFLRVQDEYLREETRKKGITSPADLTPIEPGIFQISSYRSTGRYAIAGAAVLRE